MRSSQASQLQPRRGNTKLELSRNLLGKTFHQKTVYGPPGTLDNVSAGYSKACQTWFRWNLFVRFFEVTREFRQRRLWETFLDHAALSGPRVQIGRTMSELGPSRTILASLQSVVDQPHSWILGASVLFPRTKPAK